MRLIENLRGRLRLSMRNTINSAS